MRRAEGMLRNLTEGSYYVSYYDGAKKRMLAVGRDAKEALGQVKKKQVELLYVAQRGQIARNGAHLDRADSIPAKTSKSIAKAVKEYLDDCRDRQGKSGYGLSARTVEAYSDRLPYLIEFKPAAYLHEIDASFTRQFRRFLRNHPNDLSDRTCYNIMQSVSTCLVWHGCSVAKPILKEMSFPEKPVIPYSKEHLRAFFAACDEEEEIIFKFFLHSMARDMEVAHCVVQDLNFDKCVLHISPKRELAFRLKGKRSGQAKLGRKVPMPTEFMIRMKTYCEGKNPRDLLFPNGVSGVQKHFLRLCKKIAKRAGLPDWEEFELHRWRKTGATRHHEAGVSVRKIQAWLGHESLEVTLAYLGVEDAADETSQEQVNHGALAEYV